MIQGARNHKPPARYAPAALAAGAGGLASALAVAGRPSTPLGITAAWQKRKKDNLNAARMVAVTFQDYVNDVRRQEGAIGRAIVGLHPFSADRAHDHLVANAPEFPSVRAWHWINSDGKIIASSDRRAINLDVSDRPHFRSLRDGKFQSWSISDMLTDRVTGEPTFVIAAESPTTTALCAAWSRRPSRSASSGRISSQRIKERKDSSGCSTVAGCSCMTAPTQRPFPRTAVKTTRCWMPCSIAAWSSRERSSCRAAARSTSLPACLCRTPAGSPAPGVSSTRR